MGKDRLLDHDKVVNKLLIPYTDGEIGLEEFIDNLLKAQRDLTAKEVNADWVKWIKNNAQQFNHKDEGYMEIEDSAWQKRKRSVGL